MRPLRVGYLEGDTAGGFVRSALFGGKDVHAGTPATVLLLFEQLKNDVIPTQFRPLLGLTGGMEILTSSFERANVATILALNDWLNVCRRVGVKTPEALISLADNYDTDRTMVAVALEGAMYAAKAGSAPAIKLSPEEYFEVIDSVFFHDYAGITALAKTWGVEIRDEGKAQIAERVRTLTRGRSRWAEKLSHDVLIDPKTGEPCRCPECQAFLGYLGIDAPETKTKGKPGDQFIFFCRSCDRELRNAWFLPAGEPKQIS